jgi:phenylacetate-coenzyme A ligase PaaK-like adenylate-forming protein
VTDRETDYLWQGTWVTDEEADKQLADLGDLTADVLLQAPLTIQDVIGACDRLSAALGDPTSVVWQRVDVHLRASGLGDEQIADTIAEISQFLRREGLERKVLAELGDAEPHRLARTDFRRAVYETWAPVGLLVHVASGNSALVGIASLVEGLLAGNVNVVKVSGQDTLLTHLLAEALCEHDSSGHIAAHVIVLRFSSARADWLTAMCTPADAVAVWGGEEAVSGVSAHVQAGCRLIEWGHKISFGYLTADAWADPSTLVDLATSVCLLDQQACSSPQLIYLDTDDQAELTSFAQRFVPFLDAESRQQPTAVLDRADQAEITTATLVAELESHLGITEVYQAPDRSWRILVDTRPGLRASPLYRTVWVMPLPRNRAVAVLRPMRRYLQTAGVAASVTDTAGLAQILFTAGVLRVTPVGAMLDGYDGEPHDGVYPLQRYSRRLSVTGDARFAPYANLDDLIPARVTAAVQPPPSTVLQGKADLVALAAGVPAELAQLHLFTGGSTGEPTPAIFDYPSWRVHVRRLGEGMIASGLNVRTDRVMNLFYSGKMYGSFLYCSDMLQAIGAAHFPMAGGDDLEAAARAIVDYRVTTLMGMPSYLWRLFRKQAETLRSQAKVTKIFYAGEHFPEEQRRFLQQEFGVELITSFAYATTELGTLAHGCAHSQGSVVHLYSDLNTVELLDEDDRPVSGNVPGRLVFTPLWRRSVDINRFDTKDLARWVPGPCDCGRLTPRIELLGRTGDIMRVTGYSLPYATFSRIANDALGHTGELQAVIDRDAETERLTLRLEAGMMTGDAAVARRTFLDGCPELKSAVEHENLLRFVVELCPSEELERTSRSGKLRRVVDRRSVS